MLTYTNKDGAIYILPDDSYGAVTAAEMDGDHEGLIMLLGACPNEYTGRQDALRGALDKGDIAMVAFIRDFEEQFDE